MLPADHLRKVVDWARERGAVVASDECYLDFGWDAEPVSVLHPAVTGGDHTGVLAVHSLSKRSNLAGYRAGFVAGDPALVAGLLEVAQARRADRAPPGAGRRDGRVRRRRARRRAAGALPRPPGPAAARAGEGRLHRRALRGRALPLGNPAAGTAGPTVAELAELGILVAPGDFYGPAGARHVRVALTATDERVAAAAERLTA